MLGRLIAAALAAATLSCGELPTGPTRTLPLGEWGSDMAHITALQTQTQFYFPGAVIVVDHPIQLDGRGGFRVNVSYPPCIGAPPPPGFQYPPAQPAVIEGTVNGTAMELRVIRADTGAIMVSADLVLGAAGRPPLCS